MHAPDGFLTAGTAVATGAISVAAVGVALRQSQQHMQDRQIPLAGVSAAFIFAAQMINFPVAAGTTGHLLGGALAACLLGPALGTVVVAVVVLVQALVFADGGLTALGYNTLNMAVVTALGGYAAFVAFRRLLPSNGSGVVAAAGLAGFVSVVLSALAFSIQWLFGASAPVAFDTVSSAMVGVHVFIGIGEGVLTALAVASVMATRPDLVHGAQHLTRDQIADRPRVAARAFLLGGVLVAVLLATVVSQIAADAPDGLERVAEDNGISGTESALDGSLFADYATEGVDNPALSLALAGGGGVLITLAVGAGLLLAVRDPQPPAPSASPTAVRTGSG